MKNLINLVGSVVLVLIFSLSAFAQEAAPAAPRKVDDRMRWNVGLGYNAASTVEFDKDKFTAGSAPYVSVGGIVTLRNHWGVEGKLNYEMEREISGGASGSGSKLQLIILEANALYRWTRLYVPVGLNYSLASFKSGGGVSAELDGRMGGQVGVGYFITNRIHASAYYKVISMTGKVTSPVAAELGTGLLSGFAAQANYLF